MCKTSLDRGRRRRSPLSTGRDKKANRRPVGGGYTTHSDASLACRCCMCSCTNTNAKNVKYPLFPVGRCPPLRPPPQALSRHGIGCQETIKFKNNSPHDDQNAIDLKLYCHVAKAHYWGCYVIFYHRHVTLLSLATFIFTYEKCTSSSRIDHKTILSAKLVV